MTTYINLTPTQISSLKKTADHCFLNGYSSTMFARTVNHDAQILGFDIPSDDDFYNMTCGNEAMKHILLQLGYCASSYGFGIRLNKSKGQTYGCTNESTWQ